MGFPTAQASLLNVAADASFNSGVYAIGSSLIFLMSVMMEDLINSFRLQND
jgi:hypothetical protein